MNTFIALLLLMFSSPAFSADPNKPHEHKGIATKFTNPQRTKLSAADVQRLKAGNAVRKQVKKGKGGRGIAIMDVAAPPKVVWSVITNFSQYPKWIDKLETCQVYKKQGKHIFARFVISAMMMG